VLPLGYYTILDLLHDRWRTLLTILSLAVVVAGYLLLTSLSKAFLNAGKQSQVTDNLVIISADAIDPMESSLDEEILETVKEIAPNQILRTFPTLFRHLNIDGRIVQVRAVPLEEMSGALELHLVGGVWPLSPHQIVVDEVIAIASAWNIGSVVNIYGTDFQVTGLVRSGENNLGAIWMAYSEGQLLFGSQNGFQIAYLPLAPGADPETVCSMLQNNPKIINNYDVYLENAVSDGYNQINHNLVSLCGIMSVIALMAITFGIYNSISLSLTERSHEIGLLRLVGFTQGKLRRILVARALVLTGASYCLGWVAMIIYINIRNKQTPAGFTDAPLTLGMTLSASILGLILATGFAFLGVWFSSNRLATLNQLSGSGEA
jgi:ABC-type transport system, involved in lipoprotein release, permease component